MQVYLIRHGIAAERGTYSDDNQRPLIKEGIEKTQKVAARLLNIGINFELILTSPLIRAKQTANILKEVGLASQLLEFEALAPEGNIESWINWYHQSQYHGDKTKLALVGHQPNLGDWAEILTYGSIQGGLMVKKAGIMGLNLPDSTQPIGNSELFLLTSPKWFT